MYILLPEKVSDIIRTFQDGGFEAYAVGGCVRDSVLGRTPEDWDITTSALPWQTKQLFLRTFDTGIEHGTITVLLGGDAFEVTTYRIDGEYEDSRHPKEVQFTRSLKEDLRRRDFTMNAMAYNEQSGLVDAFGGLEDLQKEVIRCVGNPQERFMEDALRILRAVRFAAQLGFEIESDTKKAAAELSGTLCNISAERIQVELVKLLVSPHPELLLLMYELNISKVILPEFDALMQCAGVGMRTVQSVCQVAQQDKTLRLTMLLHDLEKPDVKTADASETVKGKDVEHNMQNEDTAKRILRRLKFDNETLRRVCKLIRYQDYVIPVDDINVRRAMKIIGIDLFEDYLEVRRAKIESQGGSRQSEELKIIEEIKKHYFGILERNECISLKQLEITGNDLIDQGISSGKKIGEILGLLLEMVIEYPEGNTRSYLITYVKKHFS